MNDFLLALVLTFSLFAGAALIVITAKAIYQSIERTGCAWVGYFSGLLAMLGVIWAVWRGVMP